MPRILFVTHSGNLGGPAHSLLRLLDHLPDAYEAAVLLPETGAFTDELAARSIPYYVYTFRLRRLLILAWLIRRTRVDLVYANNFHYRSWLSLLAAKLARRPFIWHIREMVRTPSMVTRSMPYANAVIAVSDASAAYVRAFCAAEKIHVVHNGIELSAFDPAEMRTARADTRQELGVTSDQILVTSLGHVNPRKNQLAAVSVARQVISHNSQVRFCFLGRLDHTPSYTRQMQTEIATQDLVDHILLPGYVTNTPAYLAAADIYLHTATIDPHPRSVMEAMAAWLPVVAFNTDGVAETVVHAETGYLAPYDEQDALAHAILKLASDQALRQNLGAQGRNRVEQHFTAQRTAAAIVQIIDTVLVR